MQRAAGPEEASAEGDGREERGSEQLKLEQQVEAPEQKCASVGSQWRHCAGKRLDGHAHTLPEGDRRRRRPDLEDGRPRWTRGKIQSVRGGCQSRRVLWRRAEVTEHIFPAAPLEELGDRRGEAEDPQALHMRMADGGRVNLLPFGILYTK